MTIKPDPHGHGRLATFLRARIVELAPAKTQKEIARQAGYTNANMITTPKQGDTELALDRVPALATPSWRTPSASASSPSTARAARPRPRRSSRSPMPS